MAFNLRNRSFVKELDFTPGELKFLLKLSADLKAAKYGGYEQPRLKGKNIALIFEKTSTRTRCAFEVAAYDQGAKVTYLLYLPLSFLIPSSSGLATVSMPIMAPLSTFAGVPSYLVVTAYQTANGLVNLVTPTSAVVMGGLAIARVGYGVWWKFVWPVLILLMVLSILVLAVGTLV